MPHGIIAYAAYLPRHRLAARELGRALGTRGGDGRRVIASYDEDTTTMAVEAARRVAPERRARRARSTSRRPRRAYPDKTNADRHPRRARPRARRVRRRPRRLGPLGGRRAARGRADRRAGRVGRHAHRPARPRPTSATGPTARPRSCSARRRAPRSRSSPGPSTTAEFLDRWRQPGASPAHSGRSASGSRCICR